MARSATGRASTTDPTLGGERLLGSDLPRAPYRRGWHRVDRGGSVVRAHQNASSGKGLRSNAIGRSRGGSSTNNHTLVDAKALPNHVALTPGERHECRLHASSCTMRAALRSSLTPPATPNEFRAELRDRSIAAVIHSKPERKRALTLDTKVYCIRLPHRGLLPRAPKLPWNRDSARRDQAQLPRSAATGCICLWFD